MSEWMFLWFLRGKTIEEIIESSKEPKPSAELVREKIQKERGLFEKRCLEKVIANARNGDVNAIDWLAKRGLFSSIVLQGDGV